MMKNRYNNNGCGCEHEQRPCPPPALTIGNGMNVRVNIQSVNHTPMDELVFVLKFRVYGSHEEIILHKHQLYTAKGNYYALLNDKYFPQGWLMCDIELFEPMPGWPNGMKPASLKCNTNIPIGDCFNLPYTMGSGMMPNSKGYVNGFKVTFEKVDDLPNEDDEDDNTGGGNGGNNNGGNDGSNDNNGNDSSSKTEILYGIIRGLTSFNAITASQLSGLTKLTSKPAGMVPVDVTTGDTLVVLTKGDVIKKDDGIGGKVDFSTAIMGANGDSITIDGVNYKVYGETFIVSGSIGFYVV